MDRETLRRLQDALKARPKGSTERLILQAAPEPTAQSEPPSPDRFASRTAYRKALIDHENAAQGPGLDALVGRLNALGLETKVSRPSNAVVVKGPPAALAEALEQEGIEDADFDREIELIRPNKEDNR